MYEFHTFDTMESHTIYRVSKTIKTEKNNALNPTEEKGLENSYDLLALFDTCMFFVK